MAHEQKQHAQIKFAKGFMHQCFALNAVELRQHLHMIIMLLLIALVMLWAMGLCTHVGSAVRSSWACTMGRRYCDAITTEIRA